MQICEPPLPHVLGRLRVRVHRPGAEAPWFVLWGKRLLKTMSLIYDIIIVTIYELLCICLKSQNKSYMNGGLKTRDPPVGLRVNPVRRWFSHTTSTACCASAMRRTRLVHVSSAQQRQTCSPPRSAPLPCALASVAPASLTSNTRSALRGLA